MPSSSEKGDALQRAVHAIEQHIIRTTPSLREKIFLLEEKKIVCVAGVHHEIDVFVTTDPAPGYSAIHIFECKNWKKPIGKTEIIDFSEKIKATNAAHGYFIAKSFTRDARAQARKDGRLTLLIASEHDPTGMPLLDDFHSIHARPRQLESTFSTKGSTHAEFLPCDVAASQLTILGETINLGDYLVMWATELMEQQTLSFPSGKLQAGTYEQQASAKRIFGDAEVFVNGDEMESAEIVARYRVDVHRPTIISRFQVESRGRVWSFAPIVLMHGETIQFNCVESYGAPDR